MRAAPSTGAIAAFASAAAAGPCPSSACGLTRQLALPQCSATREQALQARSPARKPARTELQLQLIQQASGHISPDRLQGRRRNCRQAVRAATSVSRAPGRACASQTARTPPSLIAPTPPPPSPHPAFARPPRPPLPARPRPRPAPICARGRPPASRSAQRVGRSSTHGGAPLS